MPLVMVMKMDNPKPDLNRRYTVSAGIVSEVIIPIISIIRVVKAPR